MKTNTNQENSTPYDFEGKLPLKQAIPLGLQHVLAMFVGNLTPILIITSACAAMSDAEQFAAIQVSLLQNAMYSPAASFNPAFRAEQIPPFVLWITFILVSFAAS